MVSGVKRKYREVVAIAKFEPGFRSVFVEGVSDKYLVENFLSRNLISGVGVYAIEMIDLEEKFGEGMNEAVVEELRSNNKKRVVFLAEQLRSETGSDGFPVLCIIDRDWDFVLGENCSCLFLHYTDYNSMELYLFKKDVIERFLRQGHRINNVDVRALMDSLSKVARQLFHVHCIVHENRKSMVENKKDLEFDKGTCVCSLDLDSFWRKTMNKCELTAKASKLRMLYDTRIAKSCDARMEMRGHDFVGLLYFCVKKMKSRLSMDEEEFANVFWQYVDLDELGKEPLFEKIKAFGETN